MGFNNRLTEQQAWEKIQHFCAYQERSQSEVRTRLFSYGLHPDEVESLIARLITEQFLNEERFAKAFCGGKFRQKQWGKNKLIFELKKRQISPRNIQIGLAEITDTAYQHTLNKWVHTLYHKTRKNTHNQFVLHQKIIQSLVNKGFEYELIKDAISEYELSLNT